MSPTPHDTPETGPERWRGRRLVVAIADDPLRQWVLSELADTWFGPIEIVSHPQQILTAFGMRDESPVLLICGRGISSLEERDTRSWESLSHRLTVVLVESQENMELVRKHFPHVDAVLVQELHLGMAVGIVQSAKSGVRGFPVELVEQLLAPQPGAAARPRGGNGAAAPFAPPAQRVERTKRVEVEAPPKRPESPERRESPVRPGPREDGATPAGARTFLTSVRLLLRRAWNRIAGRRN